LVARLDPNNSLLELQDSRRPSRIGFNGLFDQKIKVRKTASIVAELSPEEHAAIIRGNTLLSLTKEDDEDSFL